MTETEISRLAHAINELRPDWPISSLTTWIRNNLSKRPYRDAAVALVWVAVDRRPDGTPASDKPARVLEAGPWWRAAAAGEQGATAHRHATPDTACRTCGDELPNCACTRDALAADYTEPDVVDVEHPRNPNIESKLAKILADKAGA
jgi:hypothetical protein